MLAQNDPEKSSRQKRGRRARTKPISFYMMDTEALMKKVGVPMELDGTSEVAAMAESMRILGVIVPVIVAKKGDELMLLDGRKRLMAAVMAQIGRVPVATLEVPEQAVMIAALICNAAGKVRNERSTALALRNANLTSAMSLRKLGALVGFEEHLARIYVDAADWEERVWKPVLAWNVPVEVMHEISRVKSWEERFRLAMIVGRSGATLPVVRQWVEDAIAMEATGQMKAELPARVGELAEAVDAPAGSGAGADEGRTRWGGGLNPTGTEGGVVNGSAAGEPPRADEPVKCDACVREVAKVGGDVFIVCSECWEKIGNLLLDLNGMLKTSPPDDTPATDESGQGKEGGEA